MPATRSRVPSLARRLPDRLVPLWRPALLALGVALLPRAAPAQELVRFPGPAGATLRALLVLPEGSRPGIPVVALHGCGGLGGPATPPRLPAREADWARRLSALGHPVLFPDSFGSRGMTEVCAAPENGITPEATRRDDALAAAAWANRQNWARPGGAVLLGWSHGGSTALSATNMPVPPGLVRAAVALYPGCVRPGRPVPDFRPVAPVLMLLGEADNWTPAAPCRVLAERAGPGVTVVSYPGAQHGFDQPDMPVRSLSGLSTTADGGGTARMGTDAAARADALVRVPTFLATWAAEPPRAR
ncbi:dienelactone hydrolase family protein [Roseomonas sp. BN140053]|uniref:dienelactone hydrolase family protein n=1 Tax=Roseomonas sp. BN140053 TaxID=3391898 RepID=UPI0039EBB09D